MQLFGSLELLMALLGSSWSLLGPIWFQNCSQNDPKSCQKHIQKIVQKMTPEITKNGRILDPKMGAKMGQDGETGARRFLDGGF